MIVFQRVAPKTDPRIIAWHCLKSNILGIFIFISFRKKAGKPHYECNRLQLPAGKTFNRFPEALYIPKVNL